MRRPCVAILSPFFPPGNLAAVHRARHLARHLPGQGWDPVVLCVDHRHYDGYLDDELASLLPPDLETIKVSAFPTRWARKLGLGDLGIRAWWQLRSALIRLLKERPVDVVLITGSPYYPMLLARMIRKRFSTPVVLDFQDPWVSRSGARHRRASKAGLSHALAVALEPGIVRNADFITAVSERQNLEMRGRYPWLATEKMAAIPIGGDPDDFGHLSNSHADDVREILDPDLINFSYVGTYWAQAEPAARSLLRGAKLLRERWPDLARTVRFNFVGTRYGGGRNGCFIARLAAQEGVADMVREVPDRRPYGQALRIMSASSVLLLIGSDEPHYTASKLQPILMSGRPFLSLLHCASSAHATLAAAGGGTALCFEDQAQLTALEPEIARAMHRLATDPASVGKADPIAYADSTAASVAGAYADIFNSLSASET